MKVQIKKRVVELMGAMLVAFSAMGWMHRGRSGQSKHFKRG